MSTLVNKNLIFLCFVFLGGTYGFAQSAKVTVNQNEKIPQLLSLKMQMNGQNAFGERYKIQIYYGSSDRAKSVVKYFKKEHPGWSIIIKYQAPNYKVWVGDYRNRLEADRAYAKIKDDYSTAFIFKPNS